MLNKQNLWFITLFSLILILGIYYVTIPNDVLEKVNKKVEQSRTKRRTSSRRSKRRIISSRNTKSKQRNI